MHCWKSVNPAKDFGLQRLRFWSFSIGMLTFFILFVPFSILHGTVKTNEDGLFLFALALLLLPLLNIAARILPMKLAGRQMGIRLSGRNFPFFTYYTESYLTKKASLTAMMLPSVLITAPSLAACFFYQDFYVYILLFTCFQLGFSFLDFVLFYHLIKAPRKAVVQQFQGSMDILLKTE